MNEPITPLNVHDVFHQVWYAELYNSGGYTIQLNQLIISICIAVLGILLAKWISKGIAGRLVKHSSLTQSLVHLIEKFSFYLLALVVILIALPMAGIPITIFTVVGGALAIGVGFGAQNLFSNLISGFFIMAERSVRVGDIVEVDGQKVAIQGLGNRCVRVRRGDGVDMLVPNSFFVDQTVTNWTLSDNKIKGSVSVGVAYGSDTLLVKKLLLQAASEQKAVLDTPGPGVLFTEFGDNSLNFLVAYWTPITSPLDLLILESNIRFRIDELFHENNIAIPFPQRDVHLDTLKPLEVKVSKE